MVVLLLGFVSLSLAWIIRKIKKEEKCLKRAALLKKIGLGLVLLSIVLGLLYWLRIFS